MVLVNLYESLIWYLGSSLSVISREKNPIRPSYMIVFHVLNHYRKSRFGPSTIDLNKYRTSGFCFPVGLEC